MTERRAKDPSEDDEDSPDDVKELKTHQKILKTQQKKLKMHQKTLVNEKMQTPSPILSLRDLNPSRVKIYTSLSLKCQTSFVLLILYLLLSSRNVWIN